ncbi:hypothetical protein CRI94_03260 [Longibacter salinarum]|uniref:Uncharacterized protein n=1 Tax=Longibacter salinarum TaxID=1850348 RepID=A0A2A8D347_9BACT|nr:hypothetical protein [Longibacter salinarum]PEN15310.1 hypothetical protein CRI94_03260 [Longibacter salinarum]
MTESGPRSGTEPTSDADGRTFVDTPYGLFTEQGLWFHVREEELETYATDVLDAVSIDTLVAWASVWLRSPRTLSLWLLPIFLWTLSPVWAAGAMLGVHGLWTLFGPSLVSELAARLLGYLENVLAQALYYVLILSALASSGAQVAVIVGLSGFIALRFQLVDKGMKFALRPAIRRMYSLPLPDQVLRAFLIRVALNRRLPIPQLDEMASEMLDRWGDSRKPGN